MTGGVYDSLHSMHVLNKKGPLCSPQDQRKFAHSTEGGRLAQACKGKPCQHNIRKIQRPALTEPQTGKPQGGEFLKCGRGACCGNSAVCHGNGLQEEGRERGECKGADREAKRRWSSLCGSS